LPAPAPHASSFLLYSTALLSLLPYHSCLPDQTWLSLDHQHPYPRCRRRRRIPCSLTTVPIINVHAKRSAHSALAQPPLLVHHGYILVVQQLLSSSRRRLVMALPGHSPPAPFNGPTSPSRPLHGTLSLPLSRSPFIPCILYFCRLDNHEFLSDTQLQALSNTPPLSPCMAHSHDPCLHPHRSTSLATQPIRLRRHRQYLYLQLSIMSNPHIRDLVAACLYPPCSARSLRNIIKIPSCHNTTDPLREAKYTLPLQARPLCSAL
jgi:hypothetical protein